MKPFIKMICGENVDKTLIRAAERKRPWMDNTRNKFAYRCLPLVIANEYGWEFCSPDSFKAVWYGDDENSGIDIISPNNNGFVKSHFGSGIITFSIDIIVVTDENHNLMVTGPLNNTKHGIVPLSAVIESDWMPYTFTMNWKFTEENSSIEFGKGEPFCRIFPIPKHIEEFDVSIENNSDNNEICQEMRCWAKQRDNFNSQKNTGKQWSASLPGLYYKGTFSDGSLPKTEHKTRLKLQRPVKKETPSFEGMCFDNVLTNDECQNIIKYANTHNNWENAGHKFWDNRVININNVTDPTVYNLLLETRQKIESTIIESYKIQQKIYCDIFQIIRWNDGMEQPVHADACNQDGSSNGLTWRKFGSILYLNDDFDGGKTYYPKHNIEITPKVGTLAVHLGDLNHSHGVTKVVGNTRYTLAAFWGFDESKGISL